VGRGRIGQAVAHRARAFGLEIAYHNRKRLPEAVERMFAARWVETLDELLAEADIVTLHSPATPETHNMIDARRLGLMKQGACLINTARGDLVDQEALIAALADGRLGGSDGCNSVGGAYAIRAGRVELSGGLSSTRMACADQPDLGFQSFFEQRPTLSVQGSTLILKTAEDTWEFQAR